MSTKFNKYARQLDDLAKAAFAEYLNAESAYKAAVKAAKDHPARSHYGTDYEEPARVARCKADLITAENNYRKAQDALQMKNEDVKKIRQELKDDLTRHYAADPTAIDESTMKLIDSGILKPHEYRMFMDTAQKNGNYTMQRLIAAAADRAADTATQREGINSENALILRSVAADAHQLDGSTELQTFDSLAFAFDRTSQNPAMIDAWDSLTADAVERF